MRIDITSALSSVTVNSELDVDAVYFALLLQNIP
jgi:hypothetical protein